MIHTQRRDGYTDLLGWTDAEYARHCAEQELAQYEKEQRILRAGFTCQVKREPIGRTYDRPWSATNEQQEKWE